MLRFFYKTRPIAAVLLTASGLLSWILSIHPFNFYLNFLYIFTLSIPFCGKLLQWIPFRLFQVMMCIAAICSLYLSEDLASAIFFAFASGGALLLCTRETAVLFARQNPLSTGKLCFSTFLSALCLWIVSYAGQQNLSLWTAAAGFLFFQDVPISRISDTLSPLTERERDRFRKPCFFTASVVSAVGLGFGMCSTLQKSIPLLLPQTSPLFWIGLLAGPLFTGWFAERKGIFSGCMLVILLSQSPLLLLLHPSEPFLVLSVQILLLAAAGGFPVVLAVLTYYLYGLSHYPRSFGTLFSCIPIGLILVVPFISFEGSSRIPLEEPAVCLFCLFPLSFFCIFFAWKQRFVLLKKQGI